MPPDRILKCAACATPFLWLASEQDGPPPPLCTMCRRLAPQGGRQRGVVKWYSRGKGYGFITPAEGAEVFVHKSGLRGEQLSLRAGQLVEFSLTRGPRGAQADDIEVLTA